MNGTMKFYLLAEEGGWNTSIYAFEYAKNEMMKSKAYTLLTYNLIEAKTCLSQKAIDLIKEASNINFEPKTTRECFVNENKLLYLAKHSFPEFYLNPLSIDQSKSYELSTVGELMVIALSQEMSINDLILCDGIDEDKKKEVISDYLDDCYFDMEKTITDSIQSSEMKAMRNEDHKKENFSKFLSIFQFILFNLFLLWFMCFPNLNFKESIFSFTDLGGSTIIFYIYFYSVLIYDFAYVLYHCYLTKLQEPLYHARRLLRKNPKRLYNEINSGKEKLYTYICNAIESKSILKDDLKSFSKLSTTYIDLKTVLAVGNINNNRAIKILRSITYAFITICYLFLVLLLVVLLIGSTFNIII